MADRPPLIYVDASVYLDLVTRNDQLHKDSGQPRWQSARQLFDAVKENQVRLASSALIEAEVLCNGKTTERRRRSKAVRDMLQTWFTSPNTMWVDIDRFLARDAARLRAEYGHLHVDDKPFGAADALHLAAALRAGCGYLMTHDDGFPIGHNVEGTRVVRPSVVWQQTLFDK